MNRLLNSILVISVLLTQTAWAVQGIELNGGLEQGYTQPVDQHDEVAETCNHFCHGSAHLVAGLFSDNNLDIQVTCDSHEAILKNQISSLDYQPPTPPPNFLIS